MELRKDPIVNVWTIMAPNRKGRPGDVINSPSEDETKGESCPFCKGKESNTPTEIFSVNEAGDWLLRVFPNKYPALRVEGTLEATNEGNYDILSGIGAHEVFVYTPEHTLKMQDHDPNVFYRLFYAAKERMMDLQKDLRFAYMHFFQNKGTNAGSTLWHPHAQLLALPIIPTGTQIALNTSGKHYLDHKRCLFCDIIRDEMKKRERVIDSNEKFLALCPFASRFPFNVSIYPINHSHDFLTITDRELFQLGDILARIFKKMGNVLDDPHYNLLLHTSPTSSAIEGEMNLTKIKHFYHWRIELIPKITNMGGVEHNGVFINTVLPEEAADLLRY